MAQYGETMQKDFFDKPWLRDSFGRVFSFLSPNAWTTLSLLFSVSGFTLVALGYLIPGLAGFILGSLCDFIDGKVARFTGKVSRIGAWWDGVADRFTDALFIGAFFFFDFPCSERQLALMLFALLFSTLMPPFIVAYANHRGAVPDPTERVIWRFAFRFEYLVILGISSLFQLVNTAWSLGFLWAALVLMAATVLQSLILVFIKAKNY